MKRFLGLRGMTRARKVSLVLVAVSCVSVIGALLTGVTGSLPAPLLWSIAATTFVFAFVPIGPKGTTRARKVSLVLVAISCVSLIATFLVGISENPLGITLCYVAATTFMLAFVHTWRRARNFEILLGAGVIGFVLFAVLHNVFYALGIMAKDVAVLPQLLEFLHAAFFLIAIMVCPPAALIGAVGRVVVAVMNKGKQIPDEAA